MSQRDIERLRALEKEIRAECPSYCGPDVTYQVDAAAVWAIADKLAGIIAELGQEVGAVAERVETGVVQFGDDWPGVFIRGDNAFATAMHLRGEDSVWRNSAIKSLAELLESCNVASNPNVRVLSSPAHTSEARDAARYRFLRGRATPRHLRLHYNTGMVEISHGGGFDEAIDAAMRQEGGTP